MATIGELIFWIVALVIALGVIGGAFYWERKVNDPFYHDPHADDFNKDLWEE